MAVGLSSITDLGLLSVGMVCVNKETLLKAYLVSTGSVSFMDIIQRVSSDFSIPFILFNSTYEY